MSQSREQIMMILSEQYFEFLNNLAFQNELYMQGIKEGKNKFLANLHIFLCNKNSIKKGKLYTTDFITPSALEKISRGVKEKLHYEHIVPKSTYIQDICEQKAMSGTLSIEFIYDLLMKYLWTATVTEEEHNKLDQFKMPSDWDSIDIMARYNKAGITLIEHTKDYLVKKKKISEEAKEGKQSTSTKRQGSIPVIIYENEKQIGNFDTIKSAALWFKEYSNREKIPWTPIMNGIRFQQEWEFKGSKYKFSNQ